MNPYDEATKVSADEYAAKLRADRRHRDKELDAAVGLGVAFGSNDCSEKQQAVPHVRVPIEIPADKTFGHALEALQSGQRATRAGWNGGGQWLELQRPNRYSKMTKPYIFIKTAQGDLVPWLASQTDLLARDWAVIPVEPSFN